MVGSQLSYLYEMYKVNMGRIAIVKKNTILHKNVDRALVQMILDIRLYLESKKEDHLIQLCLAVKRTVAALKTSKAVLNQPVCNKDFLKFRVVQEMVCERGSPMSDSFLTFALCNLISYFQLFFNTYY